MGALRSVACLAGVVSVAIIGALGFGMHAVLALPTRSSTPASKPFSTPPQTPTPRPITIQTSSHLPGQAARLLPQLSGELIRFWPSLKPKAFVAAVIEQESGWQVRATLRTQRELGCGLGQITLASRADGSVRFDALQESKRLDPSLAGWNWRDCYQEQYQLRGVVLKLRSNDQHCRALMADNLESLACAAAQYNGGAGSVTRRIHLCHARPGCDPQRWFGHLEYQVVQSTRITAGYGESFASINSRYPARVFARMAKYEGQL